MKAVFVQKHGAAVSHATDFVDQLPKDSFKFQVQADTPIEYLADVMPVPVITEEWAWSV
jgi:diphthamide synthase (EF-2-diphthine--ammonia ligase)